MESVHGMAPDATIVYIGAPNNYQDLDAAMNHVVDKDVAPIIANSAGFAAEALASRVHQAASKRRSYPGRHRGYRDLLLVR